MPERATGKKYGTVEQDGMSSAGERMVILPQLDSCVVP